LEGDGVTTGVIARAAIGVGVARTTGVGVVPTRVTGVTVGAGLADAAIAAGVAVGRDCEVGVLVAAGVAARFAFGVGVRRDEDADRFVSDDLDGAEDAFFAAFAVGEGVGVVLAEVLADDFEEPDGVSDGALTPRFHVRTANKAIHTHPLARKRRTLRAFGFGTGFVTGSTSHHDSERRYSASLYEGQIGRRPRTSRQWRVCCFRPEKLSTPIAPPRGTGASRHCQTTAVRSTAFRRPGQFSFLVLCVLYLTSACDERTQRIRKKK
jgi:hypothetical protein